MLLKVFFTFNDQRRFLQGKNNLPPEYSLVVFKQLGLTDEEISRLLR